jgi:deoxycytidine triphosphate deaminase
MPEEVHSSGFQEKYLWEDPLLENERFKDKMGPVLLADEIREYVEKYGLLIADKDYFFEKNLKGASYSMRPDPEGAWQYNEQGEQSKVDIEEDDKGKYYRVKQNSLVYIRLQQQLILPFYIIGRHNLTIKYVYQGLLLGTGPQVDPGWRGKLYIPLHNLTNRDVKVYLDESFVSIDFVRTSLLILDRGTPDSLDDFYNKYEDKRPISHRKIARKKLWHYLQGTTPSSSMQVFVPRLEESEKKVKKSIEKLEKRRWVDWGITTFVIAAIVVAGYNAYFHLEGKLDSKIPIIFQEGQQLSALEERLEGLEQAVPGVIQLQKEVRETEVRNAQDTGILYRKLENLEDTLSSLNERVKNLEKYSGTSTTKSQ